ncbi:polyprenyl synthetase family protein [Methanocella arvoryzae]|uniref:Farnesyltranstransferase n=1 Tax=Methanocella arvoryzae (strain DSM 22066 / NBRC 105507 / MRE50) TaxID=351160 RepID=Q0W5A4_METAR|nr:polyprenyl synthetase family protein [Methanocella arvoryzae]CAJ36439.2 putative farnesyltranstransferase [Methanocella arvoryzae MRE50]
MRGSSVDIEKVLESRATLIDKEMGLLSFVIEPPELAEVVRYALCQKGKKIRASLLTIACEAVGGNIAQAMVPAAVVEMIHNTSLVLDDVIDNAETRRGRSTINHRWGNNMALIACDALLALTIRQASKSSVNMTNAIIECAANSMLSLAEGEALELVGKDYTLKDYYKIAERKTASLFSASAEIGALVGGGTSKEVKSLREYGTSIGIAFQIRDDILDVTSSNDSLGKPTLIDLKMDRPTVIMLLAHEEGLTREKMLAMSREDLQEVLKPSVARAEMLAREQIDKARRQLESVRAGPSRDLLFALSDYVLARGK